MNVNTNAAIAENDQFVARVRDRIRSMDRATHSIVANRLHEIHMSHDEDSVEAAISLGLAQPVDILASMIGAACGLAILNEIALEKWGPNGSEMDR